MNNDEQSMIISGPGAVQTKRKLGNTIVFPKELRDAIPAHSARVLEFDRVSGATNRSWMQFNADWLRTLGYDPTAGRAQVTLLAHETGKLSGQYEIGIDLDAETMRALGQFLIQLADRADAEHRHGG